MAAVPYDSPSGIGLGQRDPWTVKHIRPFDRWPDSTSEQERIWDLGVIRVPSFNYEFGSRVVRELTDDPKLEDEDKFVEYFKTYLYGKAYKTYFCDLGDQEPVVVIIQGKEQPVLGPAVAKKMQSRKVMIISKKDDERLLIPLVAGKVRIKDMLRQLRPDLQTAEFRQIVDDTIDTDLLDFMTKQIITNYKFGVLYQRAGQTEEDQWYNNVDGSSELEEFLTFLGDRITLNGWNKFRGGLSVTDEKTGTHSIYTTFKDLEIMFHVSTYIPYYPNDPQQVERKRHLGNDVVVIVFRESDCTEPFDPLKIKSQFNHTFCVVQPLATKESGITQYKICFVSRDTGLPYGPLLPSLPTFARTEKLRKWLLTKLVNAERAAMYSPEFKERLWKARKMILHDLVSRHANSSHSTRVGAAAATSVDAVGGGLKKIITAPVTVARAVPLPLHMHEASKSGLTTSMRSPGRSTANPSVNVVPPIATDEAVSTIEPTTLLSGSFGSPKKSLSSEALPPMSARDRDREAREREKEKEKERVEKEKAERERERVERKERERLEKEREKADKERDKAERAEKEAAERERKERERKEKEVAEAAERERRDRERKEREAAAKEAAALQKSSPAKGTVPLSMAPEDRPMFMEDEAGFSPPMTKAKERAAAEKAAAAKKKPR